MIDTYELVQRVQFNLLWETCCQTSGNLLKAWKPRHALAYTYKEISNQFTDPLWWKTRCIRPDAEVIDTLTKQIVFSLSHSPACLFPALASLEASQMIPSPVEGLEARLATLREGVVDVPTTEGAVERAQVSSASSWWMNSWLKTWVKGTSIPPNLSYDNKVAIKCPDNLET